MTQSSKTKACIADSSNSYDVNCVSYTMSGTLSSPTFTCNACIGGYTLKTVNYTAVGGGFITKKCLANSNEVIPFCD